MEIFFFFFEEKFFKKEEKQLYQLFYILHSAIILKNYFTFLLKNLNLSLQWAQVNVLQIQDAFIWLDKSMRETRDVQLSFWHGIFPCMQFLPT